jgi:glutamate-1-semialdehyde 2,1-aminomutase
LPSVRIIGDDDPTMPLSCEWSAECTRRGAYLAAFHNGFVSAAHTDEDISLTGEVASDAFAAIRKRHG